MLTIKWEGRTYRGTAQEIVTEAKLDSFIVEPSRQEFKDQVAHRVRLWNGEQIQFDDDLGFLTELARLNIIQIL